MSRTPVSGRLHHVAAASPFGWGGLVGTALMGVLAVWGQMRSSSANKTDITLT